MSEINFRKHICVDPSFFTSIKRLDTLPSVLNKIKNIQSKIVLPSTLKPLSKKETDEKYSRDDIISLLREWDDRFNLENSGLEEIQKRFETFETEFKPIYADELVGDLEKIGPESIHLKDAISKLGRLVGKTIFELTAVCSEKSGIILSYGRRCITFIRKLSSPALEAYSKYKHSMIDSSEAPEYLKIIGFTFTSDYISNFIREFQLSGLSGPLIGEIGSLGLAIIANG